MAKPDPSQYRTRSEYRWALRGWRKRTGGRLWTTVVLAMIVGGLSHSTTVAFLIVFGSLAVHLYLRRTR